MEQIHGIAYSGYVGHCVQSPHLMEMNVSHRTSVRLCFRFGNGIIYGPGMTFYFLREFQSVDEPGNVPRRRMMMTAMMMVNTMFCSLVLGMEKTPLSNWLLRKKRKQRNARLATFFTATAFCQLYCIRFFPAS